MPNFSVNEQSIHMPVWVENPTPHNLTWRYDSEYTTFTPGFFRNLETDELWPMDISLAVHFQKSLPALKFHTVKPVVGAKKAIVIEDLEDKPVAEMSMQELRLLGKKYGKTFAVGMKKEAVQAELQALISNPEAPRAE